MISWLIHLHFLKKIKKTRSQSCSIHKDMQQSVINCGDFGVLIISYDIYLFVKHQHILPSVLRNWNR